MTGARRRCRGKFSRPSAIREACRLVRRHLIAGTGEWRQRLKRDGTELTETVALPVKDPYHLPRALYYAVESLDRILRRAAS